MMRQMTTISCACLALLFVAGPANAKLNKANKTEIQGHVNQLKTSKDVQVLVPTLVTWGHVADRKATKEIQVFKTHKDPKVRLAAGLSLINAKDRGGEKFLVKQLESSTTLYLNLRDVVGLLDDKQELKIIDKLLKKAKPETKTEIYRYLSEQKGVQFNRLVKVIQGKDEKDRVAAVQAIIASGNPEIKSYLSKLLVSKKEPVKLAALELGLRLAKQNFAHRVDTVKLLELAMADKSPKLVERASLELTKLNSLNGLNKLVDLAVAQKDAAKRQVLLTVALEAAVNGLKPNKAKVAPLVKMAKTQGTKITAYRLALLAGDTSALKKAVDLLGSNTYNDRLLAVQVLGYADSVQAAKLLSLTLFEGNRLMRLYSAQGLRILAKPVATKALSNSVQREGDTLVKAEVLRALGALKTKQAFNILQFQATSTDPVIKLALLDALKSMGNKDGFRIVEIMIRDRDDKIKWQAFVTGLYLNTAKAMQYKSTVFKSPPANFLTELAKLDKDAKKNLFQYLADSDDASLRGMTLAFMLKRMNSPIFASIIRTKLRDDKSPVGVRRVILDHFAKQMNADDQATVEVVARSSKNIDVARHATLVLAKQANKSMEATFRGLSSNDDDVVKALSVYGLSVVLK